MNEDCFYYYSYRNNVVVLFGTLKVQSFVLTEVRDSSLLIVITSSFFPFYFLCVCGSVCMSVCMCVRIWQFHVCRPMITSSIQNQILDMTMK